MSEPVIYDGGHEMTTLRTTVSAATKKVSELLRGARPREPTKRTETGGRVMRARAVIIGIMLTAVAVSMLVGCSSTTSPSDILAWFVGASWVSGADFTSGSTRGASLVWDGDDSLFTCNGHVSGGTDELWRYDISTDTWTQLGTPSISVFWSTCFAWTGGDEMYVAYGNGTSGFWRYTISTDDWTQVESFPESGVRRMGHSLVWPGSGDYVYLAKGDDSDIFARYDTGADAWEYLAAIPQTMGNGTQISWGGGESIFAAADQQDFFEYDIATDTWETRAALPETLHHGAWMCYDHDESLFLARGDSTDTLWRYDIPGDSWEEMTDIPLAVQAGGTMVSDGGAVYLLPGGASTDFWIFKP